MTNEEWFWLSKGSHCRMELGHWHSFEIGLADEIEGLSDWRGTREVAATGRVLNGQIELTHPK
jgi:hypothetical protein